MSIKTKNEEKYQWHQDTLVFFKWLKLIAFAAFLVCLYSSIGALFVQTDIPSTIIKVWATLIGGTIILGGLLFFVLMFIAIVLNFVEKNFPTAWKDMSNYFDWRAKQTEKRNIELEKLKGDTSDE
jgi:hypothetical protein